MNFFRQTKETKRKLSFFVALAMVISLLPVSPVAKAAATNNITVKSAVTGASISVAQLEEGTPSPGAVKISFTVNDNKKTGSGAKLNITVMTGASVTSSLTKPEATASATFTATDGAVTAVVSGKAVQAPEGNKVTYSNIDIAADKTTFDIVVYNIYLENSDDKAIIDIEGSLNLVDNPGGNTSNPGGNTSNPGGNTSNPGSNTGNNNNGYISGPGTNPSNAPSNAPSSAPSANPSSAPSNAPGTNPSNAPGTNPTNAPGTNPSNAPGTEPTNAPGTDPTNAPSNPTKKPSTSNTVKVGKKATVSGSQYKVTAVKGTRTVQFTKGKKNAKNITVPSTVKINGKSYKVTVIAKNALKGNKKLKKLTIGANIKKIGVGAFQGCSKLKNIVIKTNKLTKSKVGKNAFKGINKKATIKVPKAKVKAYKKIVQAKGAGKGVKVKK